MCSTHFYCFLHSNGIDDNFRTTKTTFDIFDSQKQSFAFNLWHDQKVSDGWSEGSPYVPDTWWIESYFVFKWNWCVWFCLEDLLYNGSIRCIPLYANHKIILTAESVWSSQYFIFYFTFPNTYPSSSGTIRGLLFIDSNERTMNMNECQLQTHILYVNERDIRSVVGWDFDLIRKDDSLCFCVITSVVLRL